MYEALSTHRRSGVFFTGDVFVLGGDEAGDGTFALLNLRGLILADVEIPVYSGPSRFCDLDLVVRLLGNVSR